MVRLCSLAALALVLSACALGIDEDAEADDLMRTDLAFGQATAARGIDGWVEYFADEGVMFRSGGLVVGPAEIREFMGPTFADSTFSLEWEPVQAHTAAAGDLGYTIGRYESRNTLPNGAARVSTGSYVTIWKKQPDGAWKAVLDIGNPDTPFQEGTD